MKIKLFYCLALAGLFATLFPSAVQASPGILDHVNLQSSVVYMLRGEVFEFWAGAYDSEKAPIIGLNFTWSVVNGGGAIIGTGTSDPYSWAVFKAGSAPGTFYNTVKVVVTQESTNLSATATVTVAEYPPHIYQAENAKCQLIESVDPDNLPSTDNCVDYSWSGVDLNLPPPYNLYWGAATIDEIKPDIATVIGNWQAAIPYLPSAEATQGHDPKLIFYYKTSPCGIPAALGCHMVTANNTLYDTNRAASYWNTALIEISSGLIPSSGALTRAALVHEMGHHYGLDERYTRDILGMGITCNTFEGTVMNTIDPNNPNYPGCPWRDAPTGLDKQRVDMFWRGGTPLPNIETRGDLPILADAVGPVATYRWQDMAWAEKHHLIMFQYLDPDPPWDWIDFAEVNSPYWGGVHLYTESRTMGWIIDISTPEFSYIPNNSTHRACSWAYYAGAGYHYGSENGYGNDRCSDSVVLTRPSP